MESLLKGNLKPVVGTVVTLSTSTEDEDLNEFLEEHGNHVLITSREEDMYWGDIVTDRVTMERIDLPYHFEYRDIENVDYIHDNINNEERYFTKKYIQEMLKIDNLSVSESADKMLDSLSDKQLTMLSYLLATREYNEECYDHTLTGFVKDIKQKVK